MEKIPDANARLHFWMETDGRVERGGGPESMDRHRRDRERRFVDVPGPGRSREKEEKEIREKKLMKKES
jgi:hypothetical protein